VSESLTVVLPVRDDQRRLHLRIEKLLDVLPELTARFEIVVVDDGSSDETEDVAREMCRRYPQVRLVRHGLTRGMPAATLTGMEAARCDFVYCDGGSAEISQGELRRLWMLRHNPTIAPVPPPCAQRSRQRRLIEKLVAWAAQLEAQVAETALAHHTRLVRRPTEVAEPEIAMRPVFEAAREDQGHRPASAPHVAAIEPARTRKRTSDANRPKIMKP